MISNGCRDPNIKTLFTSVFNRLTARRMITLEEDSDELIALFICQFDVVDVVDVVVDINIDYPREEDNPREEDKIP